VLKLDLIQTVAFAGLVLFAGYGLRRVIKPLDRFNIPAPVIGGLLVSLAMLISIITRLHLSSLRPPCGTR